MNPLTVVEPAGVEQCRISDTTQIADSDKRQNRQNRFFRRFEVHGGYTAQQFLRKMS
jgi:hypothetical protein